MPLFIIHFYQSIQIRWKSESSAAVHQKSSTVLMVLLSITWSMWWPVCSWSFCPSLGPCGDLCAHGLSVHHLVHVVTCVLMVLLSITWSMWWPVCSWFFCPSLGPCGDLCAHGPEWCFRPYWARDNLGECDEFCCESCPWRRFDRSTCWPAVQHATTVPRMPPAHGPTVHHLVHVETCELMVLVQLPQISSLAVHCLSLSFGRSRISTWETLSHQSFMSEQIW